MLWVLICSVPIIVTLWRTVSLTVTPCSSYVHTHNLQPVYWVSVVCFFQGVVWGKACHSGPCPYSVLCMYDFSVCSWLVVFGCIMISWTFLSLSIHLGCFKVLPSETAEPVCICAQVFSMDSHFKNYLSESFTAWLPSPMVSPCSVLQKTTQLTTGGSAKLHEHP